MNVDGDFKVQNFNFKLMLSFVTAHIETYTKIFILIKIWAGKVYRYGIKKPQENRIDESDRPKFWLLRQLTPAEPATQKNLSNFWSSLSINSLQGLLLILMKNDLPSYSIIELNHSNYGKSRFIIIHEIVLFHFNQTSSLSNLVRKIIEIYPN